MPTTAILAQASVPLPMEDGSIFLTESLPSTLDFPTTPVLHSKQSVLFR